MGMRPETQSDDALDLGATVLPVPARACWKQALGVLLRAVGAAVPARSASLWVTVDDTAGQERR